MLPSNAIDATYTVIHCEERVAINQQQYLRLMLANAFETITANCWLNSYSGPVIFSKNEVVHVTGHRKRLDYKEIVDVHQATIIYSKDDYVLHAMPQGSVANAGDLFRLIQIIDNIQENPLQNFINDAFSSRQFAASFCNLPASHRFHHAYKGGLLRHSLECAGIVAQCPALAPVDQNLGIVAALFHDAGKVLTMRADSKNQLGYMVDHDSLTLSALHAPLQRLDADWSEAAIALRHIWTCRSSKKWGFKSKMPIASVVQMADQISANMEHEHQAFAAVPAWRNNAIHPESGERFWRISGMGGNIKTSMNEVQHG